jgi:hypothetical protein
MENEPNAGIVLPEYDELPDDLPEETRKYLEEARNIIEHLREDNPNYLIKCLGTELRIRIYLEIKRASIREYSRMNYAKNRKKILERNKKYYHKNADPPVVPSENDKKPIGRPRKAAIDL